MSKKKKYQERRQRECEDRLDALGKLTDENDQFASDIADQLEDLIDRVNESSIDGLIPRVQEAFDAISDSLHYLNEKVDEASGGLYGDLEDLAEDVGAIYVRVNELEIENLAPGTYSFGATSTSTSTSSDTVSVQPDTVDLPPSTVDLGDMVTRVADLESEIVLYRKALGRIASYESDNPAGDAWDILA